MSALEVRLGSIPVGILDRLGDDDYEFSFDPTWLTAPARPVLGQLFEDRRPHSIRTSGHPPAWFIHLLPQGPLGRAIARANGLEEDDHFELLNIVGEDLPGATIMVPCEPPSPRGPRARRPAAQPQGGLRFSLAGQQLKLSVRRGDRGLVLPVRGETGDAIAKLHDPTYTDLSRIEFATMRWAQASGVTVPPFCLSNASEIKNLPESIPTGDGLIFLIDRFDRGPGGLRVHMEDFAQILDRPPGLPQYQGRYEHMAEVLAYLAPEDLRAFCEQLVFCILCGNADAHLKNWSLVYPDGRHPRLSPAYDLVATVLYVPRIDDELALDLGAPGSRRFEDAHVGSFRLLAEVSDLAFDDVARWVRHFSDRVRSAWETIAPELPLRAHERAQINAHLARVPLHA